MRMIERRPSTPNRSNGTRKALENSPISRGADGAKADIGKMTGWICRVELAACNLNRSAVCFVMANAVRNVPKCVRIGAARLYTLAFGCQLICDQPEIRRRFFQSSLLCILHDLRKCKTLKPLATIHFAKQAPKRKISRFIIHLGRFRASKPTRFCPRDKNETAGSRFRNSLRFCPRICPKRLREDTRRDSAARWTKPTTKLDPIGMAPRQTSVKEWE